MTIRAAKSGEACCGNCGSTLVIQCTGGCPEPDAEFKANYIAALPKPMGKETPRAKRVKQVRPNTPPPPHCTRKGCFEPVAPREPGTVGRPSTQCVKHRDIGRRYHQRWNSKLGQVA